MPFHRRCGDRVTLLNDNLTAVRNFIEFNHGLILSADALKDDELFEVRIDTKVNVWNGSLEIGVTTADPDDIDLPATATRLRNSAWIMSGHSVVKDGVVLVGSYGPDLDTLQEGDLVGVMRTSKAELMFFINGRALGVAATDLPPNLFAVIDLYGQCVQVTIIPPPLCCHSANNPESDGSLDLIEEDAINDDTTASSCMDVSNLPLDNCLPKEEVHLAMSSAMNNPHLAIQDRLRFHPRCGILVKLSKNNKTAERARPLDDYNNGVVMTYRPLYDNELFEIRIDRLVDKWSGSIEVGVTSHNPATIRFPSTMTNMDSGTIMMSGCKVLINGHGACAEYGNFNLDELRENDTVGMMRRSNGNLHYYINGVDQGVAAEKVDPQVWGVIDLYGMTVKVTIMDGCIDSEGHLFRSTPAPQNLWERQFSRRYRPRLDAETLLFRTLRDSNIIIISDGKTAHRPNAFEYFNNGIVMTNRTLRTNELFQVRLDLVIPKWAGSIEIGVTQHPCNEIIFPFKMSSAKSGTWAMSGEDVIKDGVIFIPEYVQNLNRLEEGDTVGVVRKHLGILHFYVNGVDQGPAAFNVPEHVYGIIDLYGRVAQATIVDCYMPLSFSPDSFLSSESNATVYPDMCFHRVHGRNARLSRTRLTASRTAVYSEFSDAVLFSSRPLRECEMFELRIDKMVESWIGNLEIGVTAIRPDELEASGVGTVAGTATDLTWDTYILSGTAMMKDGDCVRSGYPLDLDTLTVGSRVGMMWHADRSLHYYLDGMDQGKAWYVPHLNIYAVADLYGQCTQVTILPNEERGYNYNGCTTSDNSILSNPRPYVSSPPPYFFSEYCGENVCMSDGYSVATRRKADSICALVFSAAYLTVGELFEIKVIGCNLACAGSLRLGLTDVNILNAHVNRCLPPSVNCLPHFTAYIDGGLLKYSSPNKLEQPVVRAVVPSFEWLRQGDRVGLKKVDGGRVLVTYNSELLDVAFEGIPDKVYVVMDLSGKVTAVRAVAKLVNNGTTNPQTVNNEDIADTAAKCASTYTVVPTTTLPALSPVFTPPGIEEAKCTIISVSTTPLDINVTKRSLTPVTASSAVITPVTMTSTPVTMPSTPVTVSLTPVAVPSSPDAVPPNPVQEPSTPVSVPSTPVTVPSTLVAVPLTPVTGQTTLFTMPLTPVLAPSTSVAVPFTAITMPPTQVIDLPGPIMSSTIAETLTTPAVTSALNTPPLLKTLLMGTITAAPMETPITAVLTSDTTMSSSTPAIGTPAETNPVMFSSTPMPTLSTEKTAVGTLTMFTTTLSVTTATMCLKPMLATLSSPTMIVSTARPITSATIAKPMDLALSSTTAPAVEDANPQSHRSQLPYTFHNVYGNHIRLCSSDTVAIRTKGYNHGIAIVGQPFLRGHNFKFRVDKINKKWSSSVLIGAVGVLPASSPLPASAIDLPAPCWVLGSDVHNENGEMGVSELGAVLDEVSEQTVLTLLFEPNGELLLDIDSEIIGLIGTVPSSFDHIYPVIDLYGQCSQVSVLLHPYPIARRLSIDLPSIMHYLTPTVEVIATKALEEDIQCSAAPEEGSPLEEPVSSSYDLKELVAELERIAQIENEEDGKNMNSETEVDVEDIEDEVQEYIPVDEQVPDDLVCFRDLEYTQGLDEICTLVDDQALDSVEEDICVPVNNQVCTQADVHVPAQVLDNETINIEIRNRTVQQCSGYQALHQSLILEDVANQRRMSDSHNDMVNRCIQKSQSSHNFGRALFFPPVDFSIGNVDNQEMMEDLVDDAPSGLNLPMPIVLREMECGYVDVTYELSRDTNIRHNDRYPEANEVSSMESEEIMNGVVADRSDWPDLTEEQSSSDGPTRDESLYFGEHEVWPIVNANFGYLKNLIYVYDDVPAWGAELEAEWEAAGAACEYLHTVLKYWKELVPRFPDDRRTIMWGQVQCQCSNCMPDALVHLKGWVRISRELPLSDLGGPVERVYWQVEGSLLAWVLLGDSRTTVRASTGRPAITHPVPVLSMASAPWFDEEGKPHRTSIAIEIDMHPNVEPQRDEMLSILIHLKQPTQANTALEDLPLELE